MLANMNCISTNMMPNGMIPANKVLQIKTNSLIKQIKCDFYYFQFIFSHQNHIFIYQDWCGTRLSKLVVGTGFSFTGSLNAFRKPRNLNTPHTTAILATH